MSNQPSAFVGAIPENYDRYLGPVLFEPYAADIVRRLSVPAGGNVLELACGTGIVTRKLRDSLPPETKLTATDLNPAMLAVAQKKFDAYETVEWKDADASNLPFANASFDVVVCQFGLMFIPDKQRAVNEAHRVLKPGGEFLLSVWDSLEQNEIPDIGHKTVARFFSDDPPNFYQVPFSLCDPSVVNALLTSAGFTDITRSRVTLEAVSPSAADLAQGIVQGNPIIAAINDRDPSLVPIIQAAVAEAIAGACGDHPVRSQMRAFVFSGKR